MHSPYDVNPQRLFPPLVPPLAMSAISRYQPSSIVRRCFININRANPFDRSAELAVAGCPRRERTWQSTRVANRSRYQRRPWGSRRTLCPAFDGRRHQSRACCIAAFSVPLFVGDKKRPQIVVTRFLRSIRRARAPRLYTHTHTVVRVKPSPRDSSTSTTSTAKWLSWQCGRRPVTTLPLPRPAPAESSLPPPPPTTASRTPIIVLRSSDNVRVYRDRLACARRVPDGGGRSQTSVVHARPVGSMKRRPPPGYARETARIWSYRRASRFAISGKTFCSSPFLDPSPPPLKSVPFRQFAPMFLHHHCL